MEKRIIMKLNSWKQPYLYEIFNMLFLEFPAQLMCDCSYPSLSRKAFLNRWSNLQYLITKMVDRAYQLQYTMFHFQFFKNVFSRLYETQLYDSFLKIIFMISILHQILYLWVIASLKIRNTFFSSHLLLRFWSPTVSAFQLTDTYTNTESCG